MPRPHPEVARPERTNTPISTPKTVPLEQYIRAVLPPDIHDELPTCFFRPSATFPTPTLKKGITNRVILFSGSFNPPHIGHKLLLCHAFFRSTYPNVIAAIITPASKCLDPWVLVNPYGMRVHRAITEDLFEAAAKDGFKIEFVVVGGPDYLTKDHGCRFWGAEVYEVIVSDVFRPAYFMAPDGSLEPLRWCRAWKNARSAEEHLMERVTRREVSAIVVLHLLYPEQGRRVKEKRFRNVQGWEEAARQCLEECLQQSGSSRICQNKYDPDRRLQFVPVRDFLDPFGEVEVSSTAIREVLRNTPRNEVTSALGGRALNERTLVEIMDARAAKKASQHRARGT
ncbi:hypothetical protein BU26DRAFT_493503 [Trematosphaeria pertusa]|uniref:Cytidyltransferase-like domain-containing protein n=1 Tax=Trematosphaeria pertusa TaxID=390896 RepID=A0A6A6HZ53_9PLEO|nr:uncharacterized protein BU26DRAFT_493503 [Trematosphaeria pertusa]KAF2243514.1 hypothetical protein BU26DRAFT_493503 [Trematosphaeria pertusa]